MQVATAHSRNETRTAIAIQDVSKTFVDARRHVETVALQNLSLDVEENEFIALLGPSGCGKTTLLNIVAGFDSPSSGQILLHDKTIGGPGPDRGVVFQSPNLFPWMSIYDNLLFGPKVRREDIKNARTRADELLRVVGLESFKNHNPYELSGGMQQRAAYARVLMNDPAVVLADEPFAALDEHTRRKMQRDFEDVWLGARTTVIFVTHSIEEALYLADRIFVMTKRPGRIMETLEVGIDRPRDRSAREFLELQAYILRLLEPEVEA